MYAMSGKMENKTMEARIRVLTNLIDDARVMLNYEDNTPEKIAVLKKWRRDMLAKRRTLIAMQKEENNRLYAEMMQVIAERRKQWMA